MSKNEISPSCSNSMVNWIKYSFDSNVFAVKHGKSANELLKYLNSRHSSRQIQPRSLFTDYHWTKRFHFWTFFLNAVPNNAFITFLSFHFLFCFTSFYCHNTSLFSQERLSKPNALSLVRRSLKLSGKITVKTKYPSPAPASTAMPSQVLYVITISISTYPTNTCSMWRNVCKMWILLLHLLLGKYR